MSILIIRLPSFGGIRQLVSNPVMSVYRRYVQSGVYFIVIINKTALLNGKSPITDSIFKMGIAHAFMLNHFKRFVKKLCWNHNNSKTLSSNNTNI